MWVQLVCHQIMWKSLFSHKWDHIFISGREKWPYVHVLLLFMLIRKKKKKNHLSLKYVLRIAVWNWTEATQKSEHMSACSTGRFPGSCCLRGPPSPALCPPTVRFTTSQVCSLGVQCSCMRRLKVQLKTCSGLSEQKAWQISALQV